MIRALVKKIELEFIRPGTTSRGTLYTKPSWFIILKEDANTGIGECSVIPGLNPEYGDKYPEKIMELVEHINSGRKITLSDWERYPSIAFGLEMAMLDLQQKEAGVLYPSEFTAGKKGIPINGLIWMGSRQEMETAIREKLNKGFKVLKLKTGALDFEQEMDILKNIRKVFSPENLEIRLDANGAFSTEDAIDKLNRLSEFSIHSLEQPIVPDYWEVMAEICSQSPIPIALDEELIGINNTGQKRLLLQTIKPQFIILKPSLIGGLSKAEEWIDLAEQNDIGWWSTSALESNVGLNAIAQWAYTKKPNMVQGLGTGQVFSNNIPSPLNLKGPVLYYSPTEKWDLNAVLN